ncbi:MAG: DUF1150 family protein [Pseudomonadota bacterium]
MPNTENTFKDAIAAMSPEAFAKMGAPHLAYVAPVETEQGKAYGIHGADGSLLAVVESRELAFVAARQNDLEPVSIQ